MGARRIRKVGMCGMMARTISWQIAHIGDGVSIGGGELLNLHPVEVKRRYVEERQEKQNNK